MLFYGTVAYFGAPSYWSWQDAGRALPPMRTTTPQGIPADPINVGLLGSRAEVLAAFGAAGWDAADPVTLDSALGIGLSVLFDRPYPDAPVSPLVFAGRRQDLAFEQPVGASADQRHHVRLWAAPEAGTERPFWLAAASFDRGVGFSHDTGQFTHHIAPNVDAERDHLVASLTAAGRVLSTYPIDGSGATQDGRNGGGDPFFTDGMATVVVLAHRD